MPNYGDANYWNQRYEEDRDSPFDWLFDYQELHTILTYLFPVKDTKILVVGAGNAPFSPDLYEIGGFTNICNIDLSSVVINQQAAKYPHQQWLTMDVLNMAFPDHSFPAIIDKSLIDTLLCYNDSVQKTQQMIDEIYRVAAPGSRYVTFSLHSIEEVIDKFQLPHYHWRVVAYRVKSSRWNDGEHRRRAVAHTMIICDKPDNNGDFPQDLLAPPETVPDVLTDEEYWALKNRADQVNLKAALSGLTTDQLRLLLFGSLNDSVIHKDDTNNTKLRLLFSQSKAHQRVLSSPQLIEQKFREVISFCHVSYEELVKDVDNLSAILKQQLDEQDYEVVNEVPAVVVSEMQ